MVLRNNIQTQNLIRRIGRIAALAALAVCAATVPAQDELVIQAEPLAAEQPLDSTPVSQPPASQPGIDNDEPAMPVLAGQSIQSLSFNRDTTITRALQTLAQTYRKNIIPSARITGNVTVNHLYDVTFEEALQGILAGHNYRYDIDGNFINVYTREEYEQIKADTRRMETRVFTLYYLSADEAERMAIAFLSERGSIASSTQSELGVPVNESISQANTQKNPPYQDSMVVKDYPENIQQIEELLILLDVRPEQVLIEATILAVDLTEGMEFGVDWNFAAGTALIGSEARDAVQDTVSGGVLEYATPEQKPIGQVANWNQSGTPLEVAGFTKTGGSGLRAGITSGSFAMFITALEQVTDVTILANPKILAINKQVGQVYIGTKIGYREGDVETVGGGRQEGSVNFLETGTKLSFRPYIGNDGYIRMDIHPKDSTGSLNVQGVPNETSAELLTNIMVRDGETIVIGGLFRDEVSATNSQVPILGDLPLVGQLFRGTNNYVRRQEVIVLLTPHIIRDPREVEGIARMEDVRRLSKNAYENLSWLSRSRLAEDRYRRAVALYKDGDLEAALSELNSHFPLELQRNNLEVIRLRERILDELDDNTTLERVMFKNFEKEESGKWLRR